MLKLPLRESCPPSHRCSQRRAPRARGQQPRPRPRRQPPKAAKRANGQPPSRAASRTATASELYVMSLQEPSPATRCRRHGRSQSRAASSSDAASATEGGEVSGRSAAESRGESDSVGERAVRDEPAGTESCDTMSAPRPITLGERAEPRPRTRRQPPKASEASEEAAVESRGRRFGTRAGYLRWMRRTSCAPPPLGH